MRKRLAFFYALFPSLAFTEEVIKSTEPAMGSWDWIWANIQSLDSLVALLLAVGGGAVWLFFKLRGSPSQPNHQNPSTANQHSHDELEKNYLVELDKRCEFLRLDLIAKPILDRGLRLSLSEIYQDQHIRLWSDEKQTKSEDYLQERHQNETLPLMQALAELKTKHLVIRGGVGAGKTSFINYLTHCLIQSHQGQVINDLPKQLIRRPVVRLLLRKVGLNLDESSPVNSGFMWQAIQQEISELIHSGTDHLTELSEHEVKSFITVYSQRLKQDGIILLDGLDEVSESQGKRAQLRQAIENFVQVAPNALVIVTGRPYAYERQEQKLAHFQQADLSPMTAEQIRAFVSHWYRVARQPNGWTEQQAEKRAKQLSDEIFSRPYLPEMAKNAMLLTLFIGLDYADIRLPSSRAKLYEEAVELLLQRWHQNLKDYRDNLDPAEQEGLLVLERSRDELLKALKTLAYKTYLDLTPALGEKVDTIALDFDHEVIIGHLYKPFGQSCDHDHLLYFLQYRSAILIAGYQEESFQFAHKSFHEYLAASHLMSLPSWKQKIEDLLRQNQDWWREVFLLLVKKYADLEEGEAIQLLQHLLRHYSTQTTSPIEHRLVLLVATSALELKLPDKLDEDIAYQQLYLALQNSLISIMQANILELPERAEAGRLLGQLGDPRSGITIKKQNSEPLYRERQGKRHTLPDIDWVKIPAGSFLMGTQGDEGYKNEKPAHTVDLPEFHISRSPITNAQYRCFLEAGLYEDQTFWQEKLPAAAYLWLSGTALDETLFKTMSEKTQEVYRTWLTGDTERRQPYYWTDKQWNLDNHPVVGVSWFEALAYSLWLNELGAAVKPEGFMPTSRIRLPSEEEWEYAARGNNSLQYAWGLNADKQLGNYADTGIQRTSSVGLFPPSLAFGLHDMSGNVWEWTSSRWGKNFNSPDFPYAQWQEQQAQRNQLDPMEFRIIRGGSWFNYADILRCALRNGGHPHNRYDHLGFRMVNCP